MILVEYRVHRCFRFPFHLHDFSIIDVFMKERCVTLRVKLKRKYALNGTYI